MSLLECLPVKLALVEEEEEEGAVETQALTS